MNEWVLILFAVLLPITAFSTVVQIHPYFALLSRGIMGVVAVMFYAVMGAADVALTEALVGTLLTVLLFAVAVRSSLVVRVGLLEGGIRPPKNSLLHSFCKQHKLYLKWNRFETENELAAALKAGKVDAVYITFKEVPSLLRYVPEGVERECGVTLLAEHCTWHERRILERESAESVLRLEYLKSGGGR